MGEHHALRAGPSCPRCTSADARRRRATVRPVRARRSRRGRRTGSQPSARSATRRPGRGADRGRRWPRRRGRGAPRRTRAPWPRSARAGSGARRAASRQLIGMAIAPRRLAAKIVARNSMLLYESSPTTSPTPTPRRQAAGQPGRPVEHLRVGDGPSAATASGWSGVRAAWCSSTRDPAHVGRRSPATRSRCMCRPRTRFVRLVVHEYARPRRPSMVAVGPRATVRRSDDATAGRCRAAPSGSGAASRSSTCRRRSSPSAATTPPARPSCARRTVSARARSTTTSARRSGCSPPSTTG